MSTPKTRAESGPEQSFRRGEHVTCGGGTIPQGTLPVEAAVSTHDQLYGALCGDASTAQGTWSADSLTGHPFVPYTYPSNDAGGDATLDCQPTSGAVLCSQTHGDPSAGPMTTDTFMFKSGQH